jgi:hypothetical protein
MKDLLITPAGAHLLRSMVVSCGSVNCVETMRLLEQVGETTELGPLAKIEGYGYRLKAFERIYRFAAEQNLEIINAYEMAWYFGSNLHIKIMSENAGHAGLARFLGEAAGLVTHVLLPLNEQNEYVNADKRVKFNNVFYVNKNEPGIPCFHLGVVVNVPITKEQADSILREQANNSVFVEYLKELPDEINIPTEYYEAVYCLAKK